MTDDLSTGISGAFEAPLRHLEVTGSTNADALSWAADGAPEGAVVVADHQTGGRGRWGRTWTSSPGDSLLFSIVLRPSFLPSDRMGLLSVMGGVAVAGAVRELAGVEALVKWPNDVVVDGKKLAGVLAEGRSTANGIEIAVVGIGLNLVLPGALELDVVASATSMAALGAEGCGRAELLGAAIDQLGALYEEMRSDHGAAMLRRAERISSVLGRRVTLRSVDGHVIEAVAVGLTVSGALEIESEGRRSVVDVAEVTQVRPQ